MNKKYIAVIGSGSCGEDARDAAYRAGKAIGQAGAVLVCGGLGGVMDAAAKGAAAAGGMSVGILPEQNRLGASRHLTIAIPTDLGELRNALIVRAADAVVSICGEYGTLSEIGFALKLGKPVFGFNTWELGKKGEPDTGITVAETPEEAVSLALDAAV
jgi:hypothetical protein